MYTLSSVKFPHLNLRLCKKKDKYKVCPLAWIILEHYEAGVTLLKVCLSVDGVLALDFLLTGRRGECSRISVF